MAQRKRKTNAKHLAGAAGRERDAYFAAGGDLAQWRGRSARFTLTPKLNNKRAARGRTFRPNN